MPEDKGKALIFINPNCPFSVYFARAFERIIKELDENFPIEFINIFTQSEELKKRGNTEAYCIVNGKPIYSFVSNKEACKKEIEAAIKAP